MLGNVCSAPSLVQSWKVLTPSMVRKDLGLGLLQPRQLSLLGLVGYRKTC